MELLMGEQQKYEEAKHAFQKALDAGTEKTGTLYNLLASCEMQTGDYQSALNHYNLGLQSEREQPGTDAGDGVQSNCCL